MGLISEYVNIYLHLRYESLFVIITICHDRHNAGMRDEAPTKHRRIPDLETTDPGATDSRTTGPGTAELQLGIHPANNLPATLE